MKATPSATINVNSSNPGASGVISIGFGVAGS